MEPIFTIQPYLLCYVFLLGQLDSSVLWLFFSGVELKSYANSYGLMHIIFFFILRATVIVLG